VGRESAFVNGFVAAGKDSAFVHALYLYTNAALREKPELYNDTIYQGRK